MTTPEAMTEPALPGERTYALRTVRAEARFEGVGLHSGIPVTVRVLPGAQGIAFRFSGARVPATPEHVTETTRCTRLGSVATIEHLMSALAACGVTDAEIEVDAPELPSLDGASEVYVDGLLVAGYEEIGYATVEGPFARIFEKRCDLEIAIGKGEGRWRFVFDAGDRWPGEQDFEFGFCLDQYHKSVAPARTFGFESELSAIRAAGFAKGLDATNALLIGQSGFVNAPRFADEPARHKLLDLMGDLYLAGVPPQLLNVLGERSGHEANVRAAAKLAQALRVSRYL